MFDKNEELITVVDPEYLLESEQTQELNGLITTVVSAPYSKELESAFYIGSRDIDDNNIFWLYKVDKRTKENNNIILNGTYSLFDDLKAYDVIRDKRPSNASALVGINAILEGSRWQVGNITSTHTGTANWYYVSRLEAFWEYLENWNVEFKPRMTFSKGKITGRYIDIVDKLSNDYGKWYEYGDKLLQVTAEQASDSLYTAFIGRGKGEESGNGYGRRIGFEKVVWSTTSGKPVNKPLGQDYVEIPQSTELYGYSDGKPRITVVEFQDTESPEVLLRQTYEYALTECRPKLQMKANVIENGLSELGEVCTIIRDDIGIRYKTRVFKITRNFLNNNQKTVEFGDEIVISTAQRNSNTAKVIKKQEQQTINWLDALQLELLDSYFNEDGYNYDLKADNEYDLPGGFYSFNAPIDQNPTKVIYMGAGTLAIANSKLPNGQWNFRTWGNGDGFTADLINAGTVNSSLITVKGGSSTNYVELAGNQIEQTGVFSRTWQGITKTHNISTFMQNGYFRARNNSLGRSLYFSDFGISTFVDGDGGGVSSGTINFFDQRYGTGNGITVNSKLGVVGLEAESNRIVLDARDSVNIESKTNLIVLRPYETQRQGINTFVFGVQGTAATSVADTHGFLRYGSEENGYASGLRFYKSNSNPRVQVVDDSYNTGGNTVIEAGVGQFNSADARDDQQYLRLNGSRPSMMNFFVGKTSDGTKRMGSDDLYSSSGSGKALHITSGGTILAYSSSRRFKENIQKVEDVDPKALLNLNLSSWIYKSSHSLALEGEEIKRVYGLIAEDVEDVGLPQYTEYNQEGLVDGYKPELWTLTIPILAEHEKEIKKMKEQIESLKNKMESDV